MTTDTEFETWVRSQLQEIAEGVTPRPDPYGRLVRRRRLGWLRGGLLAGVAAVAISGGVVAVAPAGPPEPTPTHNFAGELRWKASIVDAAPRGSLAADEAFTTDLAARIEQLSRTSYNPMLVDDRGRPLGEVDARVIFAEDIDDTRIAALALLRTSLTSPYQRYGVARLLWLTGPRGASAEELARADTAPAGRGGYSSTAVTPFSVVQFGGVRRIEGGLFSGRSDLIRVALAPPACEVAIAPSEDLDAWTTAPNVSWWVRTPQPYRPEFWRVTCDGVVREEWSVQRPEVTTADVTALLAGSAGGANRRQVTSALTDLVDFNGADLVTMPSLVWAGPLPHDNEFSSASTFSEEPQRKSELDYHNPQVVLLAAPAAQGGWIGYLSIDVDPDPQRHELVGSPIFGTDTDPGGPGNLLALKIQGWSHLVFALAPEGTSAVRLVSANGTVLDEAAPAGRAALLALPGASVLDVRAEALDAAGAVIATAGIGATGRAGRHFVRDWS